MDKDTSIENRNLVNKELYTDYSSVKTKYPLKTLHPKLRIWHKIILRCINLRPSTNSADYINANQKYMLYYLKKHKKLSLLFIIFEYLKELINKSMISAGNKKVLKYIPLGRLLSDVLVERGTVDALRDAQCTENLTTSVEDILDVLTGENLKSMGDVKEVIVDPESEDPKVVLKKRMTIDSYPLWTKLDSHVALVFTIATRRN